ncbi:hypothetical protein CS378_10350 [Rhodococcus ruber]|uniref:glycosyltransferase family 4 protein n=1 Tax=Rhodococcus TaxID=1827 RepID=UPI0009FBDB19|nr:hypothetical protein CS378_10350 [Rhodococcus ruber]
MATRESALDAATPSGSGRPQCDRKVVLQVGPAPGTSGGIAAVIEETMKFDSPFFEQRLCPSWLPNGKFSSFPTATRAAIKMCRSVGRWNIAHVHLSEYGSFIREGSLLLLAKLLRKPAVVTLHGADLTRHVAKYPVLTRYVLNSADLVLCLGKNHAYVVQAIAGTPTQIIANPLGPESFPSDSDTPPRVTTSPTFLFAGEVGARKGHDRLIEAWPTVQCRFPDARLRIAGPVADGYSQSARSRVDYLGNLSRTRLQEEIAAATAIVLPSRAEVLPMALIESHAQGTPTVYTKVGEWQVFQDAPGIRLVDVDAKSEEEIVASLADAMIDCASDHHDYSSELTAWTRRTFSTDVVAAQLDKAYHRVLSKRADQAGRLTKSQTNKAAKLPVTDPQNWIAEATENQ